MKSNNYFINRSRGKNILLYICIILSLMVFNIPEALPNWFDIGSNVYGASPLDSVGGAAGGYSMRRLSSSYNGFAIRVRRSSDNQASDIGFKANGDLDTTALTSFVGGGNGYIVTWYDQSGNGRNLAQSTAASQPSIVTNGNVITMDGSSAPAIYFPQVSTTSFHLTGPTSLNSSGATVIASMTMSSSTIAWGRLVSMLGTGADNSSNTNWAAIIRNSSNAQIITSNNYIEPSTAIPGFDTPFIATSKKDGGNLSIYCNGGNVSTLSCYSGNLSCTNLAIARPMDNLQYGPNWVGKINELLIYNSALSNADQKTLESSSTDYLSGIVSAPLITTAVKDNASNSYVITLDGTTESVDIAESVITKAINEGCKLVLDHPLAKIIIPHKVLVDNLRINPSQQLNAKIVGVQDAELLTKIKTSDPNIVSSGNFCQFEFGIMHNGNLIKNVTEFSLPLEIIIKSVKNIKTPSKTAVYNVVPAYNDSGVLTGVTTFYSGGKLTKEDMRFFTDHFSFYIVLERNVTFSDIADSWAKDAIEVLASRKIISGSGGLFNPTNPVKRVDFSILLNNVLAKKPAPYSNVFTDVHDSDYFDGHVLSLNKYGILDVKGTSSNPTTLFGVYNDSDNDLKDMTREKAAIFLANGFNYIRTYDSKVPAITPLSITYTDLSSQNTSSASLTSINTITTLGIMRGYPDRTFKPLKTITRAETAQVMALFLLRTEGMAKFYDRAPDAS